MAYSGAASGAEQQHTADPAHEDCFVAATGKPDALLL
jgi:hypothetical protein